jgi:hypothetical protein
MAGSFIQAKNTFIFTRQPWTVFVPPPRLDFPQLTMNTSQAICRMSPSAGATNWYARSVWQHDKQDGTPLMLPHRGLPGIDCGLPLEVLMFQEDDTGSLGQAAGFSGRVVNGSMVPCQVHGGTILLPVCPGAATCHSQYCECLYKPPRSECRR